MVHDSFHFISGLSSYSVQKRVALGDVDIFSPLDYDDSMFPSLWLCFFSLLQWSCFFPFQLQKQSVAINPYQLCLSYRTHSPQDFLPIHLPFPPSFLRFFFFKNQSLSHYSSSRHPHPTAKAHSSGPQLRPSWDSCRLQTRAARRGTGPDLASFRRRCCSCCW